MIAVFEKGKIKTYTEIPHKWGDNGIFNYHKLDPLIHYEHGWRDVVVPVYDQETQKLKELYFDEVNDNFTYRIEGLTPDELELRRTGNEVEQLSSIIDGLLPFEKVVFRQSGLMGAIFDRSLYEAFVILSNLSVSGKLADAKNQMLIILDGYQTQLK